MNKQDASTIRSFSEVERRLKGVATDTKDLQTNIYHVNNELNTILQQVLINLKDDIPFQSDISLWFFEGVPSLENEPYTEWETPTDHVGDLYFDRTTGIVYQFTGTAWQTKESNDLQVAMALTNAQLLEEDTEKKVFFDTPSNYETGDWWIKEDGTLYICTPMEISGDVNRDFTTNIEYTAKAISNDKEKLISTSHRVTETENDITQIFEQVGDRTHKTSSITQELDNIELLIDDVALYKRETEGTSEIRLQGVQEDGLLKLIIQGTGIYVTNLYPRDDLYCGACSCNDEYGGEL